MKVVDIRVCSDLVHEHNKDIVVVVDNTFMSAYFQVRLKPFNPSCSSIQFQLKLTNNS